MISFVVNCTLVEISLSPFFSFYFGFLFIAVGFILFIRGKGIHEHPMSPDEGAKAREACFDLVWSQWRSYSSRPVWASCRLGQGYCLPKLGEEYGADLFIHVAFLLHNLTDRFQKCYVAKSGLLARLRHRRVPARRRCGRARSSSSPRS